MLQRKLNYSNKEAKREREILVLTMSTMLQNHGKGKTIALDLNLKYQFHTRYADGVERIEEWIPFSNGGQKSASSQQSLSSSSSLSKASSRFHLQTRKWKDTNKEALKKVNQTAWVYEIGSEESSSLQHSIQSMKNQEIHKMMISKSSQNPSFHAEDSNHNFIWKVQNCPWPIETYILGVDKDERGATLRTTNKKYYKKFQIPAMSRLNERLKEDNFQMKHDETKNELTIYYKKPQAILDNEEKENKQRMDAIFKIKNRDDVDVNSCRQS